MSVVTRTASKTTAHSQRRLPVSRPGRVDGLTILAGAGLGAIIAQWLITMPSVGGLGEGGGAGVTSLGNLLLALGQIAGLLAAYLALLGLLLAARVPVLEATLGLDRLLRTHRKIGPYTLIVMVAHASLVTLAYAALARNSVFTQLREVLTTYEYVWLAAIGLGLMVVAGIISWRRVRGRLRYEFWWVLHLTMYLGVALAFWHQLYNGAAFIGHPLAKVLWIMFYVLVFGCIVVFRIGLPVSRALRHRMRVVAVVPEAPGIASVVLAGEHLADLPLAGGQFALWRFLTPKLWWQAHPYSISGLVHGDRLRITVKESGDHSGALSRLQPGTRVLMEGPYGAFTAAARDARRRVLLVAGGVGIAPIRTLLEDLPRNAAPVVLYRASTSSELLFRDELDHLVATRRGRVSYLVGDRHSQPLTGSRLRTLVPDVMHRSIYICGPGSLVDSMLVATSELNVPRERVHLEAFDFHAG